MSDLSLPARLFFEFQVPCSYLKPLEGLAPARLPAAFQLPDLQQLEGSPAWAEVRAAWNELGIAFTVRVVGKKRSLWCRAARAQDSDGFHVWLNTRPAAKLRRANRYCHHFVFLPTDGIGPVVNPVARFLPIPAARETPNYVRPDKLAVRSEISPEGYTLDIFIAAEALTGFDPQEVPQLGFNYAVIDRELGLQTFGVGPPLPYNEDPSLWPILELVRSVPT